MLKIKTLREATEQRGVKIALYGESGTGKTTQIAALLPLLPDGKRLLVITAEHGLLVLAGLGLADDERIIVAECTTIGEVREAVAYATTAANAVAWVVVDSVSNLADRELRARLETERDPRKAYGEVMLRVPTMLWSMVDVAALNALFIFQEDRHEINEGSTKEPDLVAHFSPLVPSKGMKQSMPYIFDAVLRLEMTMSGKRQIRTTRTRTIMAKDRSGQLLPMEEPDLGMIVGKIRSGLATIDSKEKVTS